MIPKKVIARYCSRDDNIFTYVKFLDYSNSLPFNSVEYISNIEIRYRYASFFFPRRLIRESDEKDGN